MSKIIHLLSGGIDSTVMLYDLHTNGEKVRCLLFDYGQRHVQELTFAKWHCRRLGVFFELIELPKLYGSDLTGRGKGVVVPNRNAVFLSVAISYAVAHGFELVTIGCNKDDAEVFPDCRVNFIMAFNYAMSAAGYSQQVSARYSDKPKWWIMQHGNELGVPWKQTWSCYRGGLKPCGKCLACKKAKEAWKDIQK